MSVPARTERAFAPGRWQPRPDLRAWPRHAARWATSVLLVFMVFLGAGAAGLALYASSHQGRVYEGVAVGGVRIGGMTATEAEAAIEAAFAAYAAAPLAFVADDQTFPLAPAAAGAKLDAGASVAAAMAYGRSGSPWDRSRAWARGLVRGVELPLRVSVERRAAEAAFRGIAADVVRAPTDARIDMGSEGEPRLVPDEPGVAIDLGATLAGLRARAARLDPAPVRIVTSPVPAAVPAAALAPELPDARAAVDAPLVLRADEGVWHLPPAELKRVVAVDPASAALRVDGRSLTTLVEGLAAQIDRRPVDARVIVDDDDGKLAAVPAVDRAMVDVAATVAAIEAALLAGEHDVPLVVERAPPLIVDAAAEAAAARGEAMLNAGMTIAWPGGSTELDRGDLLRALTIRTRPGFSEPIVFGLDRAVVAELLDPIAREYDRPVKDAAFRLVDGKITLVSEAAKGRALDLASGIDSVLAAFGQPAPKVTLKSVTLPPKWTGADLKKIALGDDILAEAATYYGDSSAPRRQNVERAVALESGWLVPPGGVFSYADHVRPVDEANGFVTGFGIVADEGGDVTTAPVVGGGICQVSTTLFQAAFWAGMPIEERYQHPYYIRSYGEAVNGLPGLDAMVNIEEDWAFDLKFRNATDRWLAVIMVADGENVWARLVGTDPGWDVQVAEPVITNTVPADPKMYYTESPELPAGQELVVETAQEGFDVAISRVVRKGGKVIDDYTVRSSFVPSRNTTLRGTGEG